MFFEQNKPDIRKVHYPIKLGSHQIKILAFLKINLPIFAKMLTDKINLTKIGEDIISGEIANLLNDKLRESSGYVFLFEAKKGPDILIFAAPYKPFSQKLFVIEAKRLHSRNSNDYVRTGIGRFKKEEHGKQDNIAAMLGYVQENNFDHWYNKVNSWINALIPDEKENPRWAADEQISKIQITEIGEYISKHSRITENPIILYHFWLNFCDSN
jgi:hypothetical protein